MRTNAWIPFCAMVLGTTALTTKQLMNWIIDPNATAIWNSVGTITTDKGTQEKHPKTDEEWATFRNAAAMLVESGNLLMLDGRAKDQDQWMTTSRGMADAADAVLQAAEAKDVEAYFDAGGALYEACTACHSQYLIEQQPAQ